MLIYRSSRKEKRLLCLSGRAGDDKSTRFDLLTSPLQLSHSLSSARLHPVPALTSRPSSLCINTPTGLQRCGEERGNCSKVPQSLINSWIRFRLQGTVGSLTGKQAGTFSPQIPMWSHHRTFLHLLPEILMRRNKSIPTKRTFSKTTSPGNGSDIFAPVFLLISA